MNRYQRRIQRTTLFGTFVLSAILVSGTASAQQQKQQQGQQGQQQMTAARDHRIEDRVELRLARSASLAGTEINVSVEDRTVTLSGTVGSEQDKERAMRLARQVQGVQEVKADLKVDKAAVDQRRNAEVGDEELAKQVAQKLANETFPWAEAEEEWFFGWEVEGYNWEFDVEVDDGVVTLEGEVDSYADMSEAIQAVRAVPGVRSVQSELTVDYYEYPYYGYPYYGYGYPYH